MATKPNHTKMFPKGRLWDISYDMRKNDKQLKDIKRELTALYAKLNEMLTATGGKITSEVRIVQAEIETAHTASAKLNEQNRNLEKNAIELLRSDETWEEVPNSAFW